jgi:hypothetical protein
MYMRWGVVYLGLTACTAWPEVGEGPGLRGGGGPAQTFDAEMLWKPCAWLDGGPDDVDHHNLVMPYRGHLVLPWSPEWGSGGLAFFDVSDPCAPVAALGPRVPAMRETHAIAFLHLPDDDPAAGEYAAVSGHQGLVIWDIADPASPKVVAELPLEGVGYGFDAYARVVLALTWQHPWLYLAAADNGVFVVDTTDPRQPQMVKKLQVEPPIRAGGVFALGDHLLVTSAEQTESALLDISIPDDPRPFPGGRFTTTDADGAPREHYHANLYGQYGIFARKEKGAGVLFMDLSDPNQPVRAGEAWSPEGGGGYVFGDEGTFFLGASDFGAVWEVDDLNAPVEVGRASIDGDNDTLVPYGNVMVLSIDGEGTDGQASAVIPWAIEPDDTAPTLLFSVPQAGGLVRSRSRIGLAFDEVIEPASVFVGSVRLETAAGRRVDFWASCQENQVHVSPMEPLRPGTTYRVWLPAGGISDLNGNTLDADIEFSFSVAGGG